MGPEEARRTDAAELLVGQIPAPAGDDRIDVAWAPQTVMDHGALERAWVDLFAVPRAKRRRLRSILDYFWNADIRPVDVLLAAGYEAPSDAPWGALGAPLVLPSAAALAERLVCTRPADGTDLRSAVMAWRLAFWLDDEGRALPPPPH